MLLLSRIAALAVVLFATLALGQAQSASTPLPRSVALSYEILGSQSSTAVPLANIDYDPKTLSYVLTSWTPPSLDSLKSTSSEPTSAPLLRVILPSGSTTMASLNAFDPKLSQDINIWLSQEDGEVLSASVTSTTPPPLTKEEELQRQKEERLRKRGKAVPSPTGKAKSKKPKSKTVEKIQGGPVVRVNLLLAGHGVKPQLNSRKPVQVDTEGREIIQEEEQEKTFFQKYWIAILGVGFLLVTSAAGGGDK